MVRYNQIKRYTLLALLSGLVFFSGCEKDEGPIMEDPDTRLTEALRKNKEALVAAEHGWIATIYPGAGGGFSFHIEFMENDRLRMMGDFNSESATTVMESSYHLKALQRPTLIFDTYNYIHLIHDPDRNVSGGERGEGLLSDFEFAFLNTEEDRIEFQGTYHYNRIVFEAATREQKEAIQAGSWEAIRQATSNLVQNSPFLYVEIESGTRVALDMNMSARKVSLTWMEDDETSVTQTADFTYTLDGIRLDTALNYQGKRIPEFVWNEDRSTFHAVAGGTLVPVKVTSNPLIPLHTLFGFGNDYTLLYIDGEALPAGITSEFNDVYAETVSLLNGTGRGILYTDLTFTDAEQVTVRVRYETISSGAQFTASKTFEYQRNGDRITLNEVAMNNNWNTRRNQLAPLTDYFTQTEFIIDWVEAPGSDKAIGGIYPVGNPNAFFYGELR